MANEKPQPKLGKKKTKKKGLRKVSKDPKKKLIKILTEKSHTFIRKRDSKSEDSIGGYCVDCGYYAEGQQFQCGHWHPDSTGGAILRYHPHNMHGQAGKCNTKFQQESVKINYTFAMQKKYGVEYCAKLNNLRWVSIDADIFFYQKMIELYDRGDEEEIVSYLESLI